jgi:acyl carrier protein
MNHHPQIIEAIYSASRITNEELEGDKKLLLSPETRLFGSKSVLDSLQLVGLILNIEREVEDSFGIAITLADERAMSQKSSPFKSIQTLAEYIELLLSEANAQ